MMQSPLAIQKEVTFVLLDQDNLEHVIDVSGLMLTAPHFRDLGGKQTLPS